MTMKSTLSEIMLQPEKIPIANQLVVKVSLILNLIGSFNNEDAVWIFFIVIRCDLLLLGPEFFWI